MPDSSLVDRGHLITNSLVKDIIQVSTPTNSYWNKFMQYTAANRAIIRWETKVKEISRSCLDTNGFSLNTIKSDFYLISGTKPYAEDSTQNIKIRGMAIPQMQWTAMCCAMEIEVNSVKTEVVMSGGYIASNRKANAGYSESDVDATLFPVFPQFSKDQMLMDLPMLRKGIVTQFDDTMDSSKDDVSMTAEYFFGKDSPCDKQARKNDWISTIIDGTCLHYTVCSG